MSTLIKIFIVIILFIFLLGLGVYSGFLEGFISSITTYNNDVISFLPTEFKFFMVFLGIIFGVMFVTSFKK